MKKKSRTTSFVRHLLFGDLTCEWIIPPVGRPVFCQLGGHLAYALAGLKIWDSDIGLISKIDCNFPAEKLAWLEQPGIHTGGIIRSNNPIEYRSFYAYREDDKPLAASPMSVYSNMALSFPRELLGYSFPQQKEDSRTTLPPNSIRDEEIPTLFFESSTLHCCPSEYLNHLTLPTIMRKSSITTFSLDASSGYMIPSFLPHLQVLLKGITTFFTSEAKLRALFFGKTHDLWEMADELISYGVEMVAIKCGAAGQLLLASPSKTRWQIPAYPVKSIDPTGCGDCFCGGFLAGYRKTYDPLHSALYGNVSASLCLECSTPAQIGDFLPGLPEIRIDHLKEWIRQV